MTAQERELEIKSIQKGKVKFSSKTKKEVLWVGFYFLKGSYLQLLISISFPVGFFRWWKHTQEWSQNKGRAGPNVVLRTSRNRKPQEFGFAVSLGSWKAFIVFRGFFYN